VEFGSPRPTRTLGGLSARIMRSRSGRFVGLDQARMSPGPRGSSWGLKVLPAKTNHQPSPSTLRRRVPLLLRVRR
jgi:hypothetical protein